MDPNESPVKKNLDLTDLVKEFDLHLYDKWINQVDYYSTTNQITTKLNDILRSSIALILDEYNEIKILKNRNYNNDVVTPLQTLTLVSKLLSKVILDKNKILKVFEPTIQNEIFDECSEILKKWNIRIHGLIKETNIEV